MSIVNHNKVNRFGTRKIEAVFKDIFSQVVLPLSEEGFVSLRQVFVEEKKLKYRLTTTLSCGQTPLKPKKMLSHLEGLWNMPTALPEKKAAEEDNFLFFSPQ